MNKKCTYTNIDAVLTNPARGNDESRSSHRRCSVKKGVFRNFVKFTEVFFFTKVFFNNIAGLSLQEETLL